MQRIAIETKYGWTTARFRRYSNGHLGIQLFLDGGEPLAKISTNLPDTNLEPREFHFDANNNSSLVEDIMRSGLFDDTGKKHQSGWCEYPVLKVKDHIEIVEG